MTDILIERGSRRTAFTPFTTASTLKRPIHPVPKEEFLKSVGMQWETDDVIAGIAVRLSP